MRVSRVEFTKLNLWISPSIRSEYRQVVLCTYKKQRPYSSKMCNIGTVRGEFRPRQTRQLPRAVDLKGRLLSGQSY